MKKGILIGIGIAIIIGIGLAAFSQEDQNNSITTGENEIGDFEPKPKSFTIGLEESVGFTESP